MAARQPSSASSEQKKAHSRSGDPRKRDPRKPRGKKRYGSEVPRVYTPPLRELTRKTSHGFAVIDFATDVLEIELLPWQKWLLIHALERRRDGGLRFRNVVVLVARQNGKSTLSQVLALYWLYVLNVRTVLGTAQDLDTAEDVWEGAVEIAQDVAVLADEIAKVIRVNGKKALLLEGGQRYRVKATNRRAGRGLSGDRILLDEIREHQSWDAWGAITKTTMARPAAQIWCLSNAGDMTSVVLRYLRKKAHEAIGDPDGINATDDADTLLPDEDELEVMADHDAELDDVDAEDFEVDGDDLGIFEWSAPPDCDVNDRDAWAMANPSMGYTIEERTIASACRTDPEWIFRTEVLCQWSEGGLEGPFPSGAWERCAVDLDDDGQVPAASRLDLTQVAACLDVSWNRSAAYVAVCGDRPDGVPQVEIVAARYGTDWVVDWFTDPDKPHRAGYRIAIQRGSQAWSLKQDLEDAGLEVVEWGGSDASTALGGFYDAVRDRNIRHTSQKVLNQAAGTAVIKILSGGASVIDRKASPRDASPLVAAVGARWLHTKTEAAPLPPPPLPQALKAADVAVAAGIATAGF